MMKLSSWRRKSAGAIWTERICLSCGMCGRVFEVKSVVECRALVDYDSSDKNAELTKRVLLINCKT